MDPRAFGGYRVAQKSEATEGELGAEAEGELGLSEAEEGAESEMELPRNRGWTREMDPRASGGYRVAQKLEADEGELGAMLGSMQEDEQRPRWSFCGTGDGHFGATVSPACGDSLGISASQGGVSLGPKASSTAWEAEMRLEEAEKRPDEAKAGHHRLPRRLEEAKTRSEEAKTRPNEAKKVHHRLPGRPEETEMRLEEAEMRPDEAKAGNRRLLGRLKETETMSKESKTRPDEAEMGHR